MKQYKRKLQFVAGSTYSISLPKEWVTEYKLKPQQELDLIDSDNGLFISPSDYSVDTGTLNYCIDGYEDFVSQILISAYYQGFEDIEFFTKKELTQDVRSSSRRALSKLPGAEIISEDKKRFVIKVMFDDFNIDIFQLFYRINLLIESSIENLVDNFNWDEIRLNEDEIDRLYNLSMKILTASITNRGILKASKVEKVSFVPSLILINKRLENIGDNLKKIARLVEEKSIVIKDVKNILLRIFEELNRSIIYLIGKKTKIFPKSSDDLEKEIYMKADSIKDNSVKHLIKWIFRYVVDIQEECINVSFYSGIKG